MRPRLLIVSQGVKPTGYGRVAESLARHLASRFEVRLFAVNHRGEEIERPGYRIVPSRILGDPIGMEQFASELEEFGPDAVLICHDAASFPLYDRSWSAYRGRHPHKRLVFYCPVEGDETGRVAFDCLASADQIVAYTRFGSRLIASDLVERGVPHDELPVIPHGVETSTFRPLVAGDRVASRRQARTLLFPDRPEIVDAFIVLNANQNKLRKRPDVTLEAFAGFIRAGSRDAYLYLHMGMTGSGCDVLELATELGIRERLLLTTPGAGPPAVDDERMNLIYNACDVGINTSMAEGFGLIAFEHAATGAAQLVPDHGATRELWRDHGHLVPVSEGTAVCPDAAAAILARLHDDPHQLSTSSARAHAYATQESFAWSTIADRFSEVLEHPRPAR